MKRNILAIIIIMLGLSTWNIAAKDRNYLGFSFSFYSMYDYYGYCNGARGRDPVITIEGTSVSEFEINGFFHFKKLFELNLLVRWFDAKKIFIEGGFWNVKKTMIGIGGGIRQSINLRYPITSTSDPKTSTSSTPYEFPLDFSVGVYSLLNNILSYNYEYVPTDGKKKDNGVDSGLPRVSIGLYLSIQLRLKFVMDKWKFPFYPTIGYKYYTPLDNFEYCNDPHVDYRLRSQSFFTGIYFPI